MADVSIIVPVYNVEQYLALCLDSLRRQTLHDIEIICVNDGSTDRSGAILDLASTADPRVHVVTQPNAGLSAARNAGLRAATAPIIMFVDSDDMLEPKACAVVKKAFDVHDPQVVTFGATVFPASASYPWLDTVLSPRDRVYSPYEDALLFAEDASPFVWRTAVSAQFLAENDLRFDETVAFGEDQIFHFMAYPASRKTVLLSDKLYIYRANRTGSLMRIRDENLVLRQKEHHIIARRIFTGWRDKGWLETSAPAIADWAITFLVLDLMGQSPVVRARVTPGLRSVMEEFFLDDAVLRRLPAPTRAVIAMVCSPSYKGTLPARVLLAFYRHRHGVLAAGKVAVRKALGGAPVRMVAAILRKVLPTPAAHMRTYFDTVAANADDAAARVLSTELLTLEARSVSQRG
ncbi:MAG: glycosyltransferase family 2 protein [Propionibacteriaceae bacterium]|nr:glycosyltransferase family 2 protein [Propionibacteriaceae bacterium]